MTAQNNVQQLLYKLSPVFNEFPFLTKEWHECAVDRADVNFMLSKLSIIPEPLARVLLKNAMKIKVRKERNLYILRTSTFILGLLPERLQSVLTIDDAEIREKAKECADRCRRIAVQHNMADRLLDVNEQLPSSLEISISNAEQVFSVLNSELCFYGIDNLTLNEECNAALGAVRRMCDKHWWVRKLRKIFNQAYERAAIELGMVNKYKQMYSSDLTVRRRQQQLFANEQLMSSMTVINDVGQRYSLKELSDLNVSNPKVRKAELMVRIRGFEETSKSLNHVGLFITITCPSKYHSTFAKSGQRNPKYEGLTPYQGNQYLCGVWSRIRAEWNRQDIKPYGFRIAEPQHDGTPHWHMLLFVESNQVETVKQTISHYSLMEDGDERGALENRCDFKLIDPKKGSAAGYIAKYVSKNIDGKHLDKGVYGENPIVAAQRVDAWASCWCIRQFQQIGGASVTVWRELRRLKEAFKADTLIEKAREAADNSRWQDYVDAMGGVFAKRNQQPIKITYDVSVNLETGECKSNKYGDGLIKTVKGLMYQGQQIVTRFFSWRIERANAVCSHLEFCK